MKDDFFVGCFYSANNAAAKHISAESSPHMQNPLTPINPPLTFKQKVIGLIARREKWEKNEYKTSKVILYGLLAECREIMLKLSEKNAADMNAFNDLLEGHQIVMNSSTPIETRIVRLVFGDCGRRAHIYSNLLKHAKAHGIAPKDLAEWIIRERGIENVVHNKSSPASKKVMRQELIKYASTRLENTPFLLELEANGVLEPSNDNYVSLSLAIIRDFRPLI